MQNENQKVLFFSFMCYLFKFLLNRKIIYQVAFHINNKSLENSYYAKVHWNVFIF